MKKILITIGLILICYLTYGQYAPVSNFGGPNTLMKNPNYGGVQGGLIPFTFQDTSQANSLATSLKLYNGAYIYTQNPQATWWRLADSSKWVMILPQGGGTPVSGQAWINPGNYSLFTDAKLNGGFGTLQANGIYIKTNGITRAYLDRYGIAPETGTTVGLGIDPSDSNRITYFSGSGSTPTWQETLDAGSNLDKDNLVDAAGFDFQMENASAIHFQSSGVNAYTELVAIGASVSNISYLQVYSDSVQIKPYLGHFEIDTLLNKTQQNTLLGWVETSGANRGEVGYVTLSGLTLSGGVLTNPNPTPGANTALSNLASVAVNTSIIPGTTNSIALGTTAKIWSDVQSDYFHTGGLNTTYAGYSGIILGGTATHSVLDLFDNNTRIAEMYTTATDANFFTGANLALNFYTNNSTSIPKIGLNNFGAAFQKTTASAYIHIGAATATAGTGQLKFDNSTLPTTPEIGLMNFKNGLWFIDSSNSVRDTIAGRKWVRDNITGSSFTLTNGSGTTANGTAVDLGGTLTANVIIGGVAGTYNVDIGRGDQVNNFRVDAANIIELNGAPVQMNEYGAGAATFDASGNISSVSDERLKYIQGNYGVGLKQLLKVNPIVYKWKPVSKMETAHSYIGFSAQNIRDVLGDNAIGVNKEGYLSIQDRAIMAAMVNSIKELKDLNDKQQKEINDLKKAVQNK